MNFIPDRKQAKEVPFFEDVAGSEGWEGHRTEKSFERLKTEVSESIGRLGGFVSLFQGGVFHVGSVDRAGLQVFYSIEGRPARLDIAALPVRNKSNREKSLKMALYMVNMSFKGLWFMQQLSPGYAALMPFMLADKEGHTISQLWAETSVMRNLLPPGDSDFEEVIDAE